MSLKTLRYPDVKRYYGRNPNSRGSFASGRPVGIICHYTAGGHAAERLAGRGGSNVSAHFTIDRNGDVYQCGDLDQRLWHAGVSHIKGMTGLNDWFIGIEQANFGFWRNEPGLPTLAKAQEVGWMKLKHKNDPSRELWWEPYPEPLLAATERVCRWLIDEIKTIKIICGHDDVSPGRKSDPGPAFPLARYRNILMPDNQSTPPKYKVVVSDFLNVRASPGATAEKRDWGPLQNNEIVEYLREEGSWYMIRNKDGKEGWANSLYLRRV
jgi:N-acetylmuramoyl-L-alanine amidase